MMFCAPGQQSSFERKNSSTPPSSEGAASRGPSIKWQGPGEAGKDAVYGAATLRELWRERPGNPLPRSLRNNRLEPGAWKRLDTSPALAGARRQISPALSKGGLLVLDEPEARSSSARPTADKGRRNP
jgi:hypothetical protein